MLADGVSSDTVPTDTREPPCTAPSRYEHRVADKGGYDLLLRHRIVDHVRRVMAKKDIANANQLAKMIGFNPVTVRRYLKKEKTPGLDFLYRLHVALHESADNFLDTPANNERAAPAVTMVAMTPAAAAAIRKAPPISQPPAARQGSGR